MITRRRLAEISRMLERKRVAVIGDLMIDEFLKGTVSRISPEAPVPVLEYSSHNYALGGAGNAARTVMALGGEALLVGVIGGDHAGEVFLGEVDASGLNSDGIVVAARRSTTLKTRVIAHAQQVVRIDREASGPLGAAAGALKRAAKAALERAGAVLISDYNKGGVPRALAREVITLARSRRVPVIVDTKTVHAAYKGASLLTPNLAELAAMSRMHVRTQRDLDRAVRSVFRRLAPDAVLVTRAEEGMSLFLDPDRRVDVPALALEAHDVTGAGDTVAATMALGLAGGLDTVETARVATLAASVVVRKVGTAEPHFDELFALAEG